MMRRSALSSSLEHSNHTSSNFSVPSKKCSDVIPCPPISKYVVNLLSKPAQIITPHNANRRPPSSNRLEGKRLKGTRLRTSQCYEYAYSKGPGKAAVPVIAYRPYFCVPALLMQFQLPSTMLRITLGLTLAKP